MTRERFLRDLARGSSEMGIRMDGEAQHRLYLYYRELMRWNRRVNLVSRKGPDWTRVHFLDSLAPLSLDLLRGCERMVDLGAGAGFPGVPLKVVKPRVFLGMAEVSGKKCAWLRHLVRTLELEGAEVLEGRFEKLLDGGWAGSFDLAVSRAAARPSRILEVTGRFLAPGGRLLVYTTRDLVERGTGTIHPYCVPGSKIPSVIWEVTENEM